MEVRTTRFGVLEIAPDRVITFAGGTEDVPAGVALLKGTWLALASGYTAIGVIASNGLRLEFGR